MDDKVMKALTEAVSQFNIHRLILSVIVILITVIVIVAVRIMYRRYKKLMREEEGLDSIRRVQFFRTVYRTIKLVAITLCVLAILQINGVNVSSIVVLLSVIVAAVSFGIKDMFQDFFTGLILKGDNYFKVGDAVEYDGKEGIVTYFTLRSTKIELLDDRSLLEVTNRNVTQIRKLTHLVDIDLPLSYDIDRRIAFEVLDGICESIRGIEGVEGCELKGTQRFDESAVIYKIRFFCEPNDRPDIRREALKRVQDGLREAGIRIPYKQLDIHQK